MNQEENNIEGLQQWCKENMLNKNNKINTNKLRKDYKFYGENIDIFNKIDSIIDIDRPIGDKITSLLKGIFVQPICECGNKTKWYKDEGRYLVSCSSKCASLREDKHDKVRDTVSKHSKEYMIEIDKATKKTKLER